MRKMFSKNQIKEIVNQGIESGEVNLQKAPNNEFPMETNDYLLIVGTDEDYIYITEENDNIEILQQIIGKCLYGFGSQGDLIVKAVILYVNTNLTALTLLNSADMSGVSSWKIFDK